MPVPHCFPACGTVRTQDERLNRLYQNANEFGDAPEVWEGLFRLACLLKNKPGEEPVYRLITEAVEETDDGSFKGTFGEQISTARAAMAVFEYNTDRTILARIALWLRYVEIEFDNLVLQDAVLYSPADLMELLVRFYQVSGVKSALRLCARLRAEAFDWITALHTFQQTIPIASGEGTEFIRELKKTDEMDFSDREKLTNHAEMLADGVRYTVFAGIFSGHTRDLSAGTTVWNHLRKHHRAVCGGTTGSPYLSGNAADRPVSTAVLAAWTEAFAAQMILPDSSWALEELIRIAFNGLEDCLSRDNLPAEQRVNTISGENKTNNPVPLYARITRAAAAVWSRSVTLTTDSVRFNYLLPEKVLVMIRKQPVILEEDPACIVFRTKKPFRAPAELYLSASERVSVRMIRDGRTIRAQDENQTEYRSGYMRTEAVWQDGDGLLTVPDNEMITEEAHHQGIIFVYRKRLLCAASDKTNFNRAACGCAVRENDAWLLPLAGTDKWRLKGNEPADIPVLPDTKGEPVPTELKPYAGTVSRITVFPRAKNACLK